MSKLSSILVTLTLAVLSLEVSAGPRVGNGGGLWLCLNGVTLNHQWMQLTDLFEAKSVEGLSLDRRPKLSYVEDFNFRRDEVARFYGDLDKMISENAPSTYAELEKILQFTSSEGSLTLIHDGLYQVRPAASSCANGYVYFDQLADYTNDGRILINSTLWSDAALSDLDRSALLMHEVVYKALRTSAGDENSVRARRIVAVLYANLPVAEKAARIGSILASTAPQGAEINLEVFHKRVACQGAVRARDRTNQRSGLLKREQDRLVLKIGSFSFAVATNQGYGKPTSMAVTESRTRAAASFDSHMLSETFLLSRRAALVLEAKQLGLSAVLTCWEETY